jgi:hypothetical protein
MLGQQVVVVVAVAFVYVVGRSLLVVGFTVIVFAIVLTSAFICTPTSSAIGCSKIH